MAWVKVKVALGGKVATGSSTGMVVEMGLAVGGTAGCVEGDGIS